jgi:hypothetical protein
MALRDAVDRSVEIALDMLSSRKGREFLDKVGSKAIEQWEATQHVYRGTGNDKMGNCVNAFLKQLGTEFVPICLMAAQPAIADFRMDSWYRKTEREVAAWRPGLAGTLCLSEMVCILSISSQLLARPLALEANCVSFSKVVKILIKSMGGTTPGAKEDQTHSRFSLTVAIARELVNCFIGRLSGHKAPVMPHNRDYPSWGFLWQWMMFGGVIAEFEAPKHPFTGTRYSADQAGDVWVIEDTDMARQILDDDMENAMYRCGTIMSSRPGSLLGKSC